MADTQREWEVIVGNIGTVYSGTNGFEARKVYSEYKKMSVSGYGRASDEPVSLMVDGEIFWGYLGNMG